MAIKYQLIWQLTWSGGELEIISYYTGFMSPTKNNNYIERFFGVITWGDYLVKIYTSKFLTAPRKIQNDINHI